MIDRESGPQFAAELVMNDREARRQALSEWLMEFSVLWAVFPILDRVIENKPIEAGVILLSAGISFTAAAGGMLLRKG